MSDLWCCHVIGPDDVYAAPDQVTAQKWADSVNALKKELEREPLFHAVAAPWPHSAEAHAENLPQSMAEFTPKDAS